MTTIEYERSLPIVPTAFPISRLAGVRACGVACDIKASRALDLGLIVFDAPVAVGAVFTQNQFAAAPVLVSRQHLDQSGGRIRAIVASSGNANACTGEAGMRDAREMCSAVASKIGSRPEEVLVASTGVIGVALPMDRVRAGIAKALGALGTSDEHGVAFAKAIMTTDAFAKTAASNGSRSQTIGAAKGAGMIEPNMATMLAFALTDATLPSSALAGIVKRTADASFNRVHVDSHASTNDSYFLVATGEREIEAQVAEDDVREVAARLAWLIARDGEGATKVTTIRVEGAADDVSAREIARELARSALIRTALYGCDPNWGRFVSQVGNTRALQNPVALECWIAGTRVFAEGAPLAFDRAAVSRAMKREDVELVIRLGDGSASATVMTSDLGYAYVEINAEYTT